MSLILDTSTQVCLDMQFCHNYFDLVSLGPYAFLPLIALAQGSVKDGGLMQSCPGCRQLVGGSCWGRN